MAYNLEDSVESIVIAKHVNSNSFIAYLRFTSSAYDRNICSASIERLYHLIERYVIGRKPF